MKIIRQLGLLALILVVSELIASAFSLPIPANVLGMALLFLLLCTGIVKEEDIRETADFFYQNMAFFLVPITCGILVEIGQLGSAAPLFFLAALLSTVVVYLVTGQSVQLLGRLKRALSKKEAAK